MTTVRLRNLCADCGRPLSANPAAVRCKPCTGLRRRAPDRICEACGKSFYAARRSRPVRFCSNDCRMAVLNALPREPRATAECRICGKEFHCPATYRRPDAEGKTRGVYCSRACMWTDDDYRKRRAVRHSPTRLECWLFEALDAAGVSYEAFGNVGRYVPDAMLSEYRVIIEVDGVKWHRPRVEYDRARDRDLAAAGWTVMHFTDIDLRSRPRALVILGEAIGQIVRGQARYRAPTLWTAAQTPAARAGDRR